MTSFLVRPLPEETHSYDSIQEYQNRCQSSLLRLTDPKHRPQVQFNLDLTQARNNRNFSDGKYFLINNDPAQDFFCHGQVDTFNREMDLRVGHLSDQKNPQGGVVYRAGMINLTDQCTLTRAIAEAELGGRECHDGAVDPLVVQAGENPDLISLRIFTHQCEEAWQDHLLDTLGTTEGHSFGLDRIGVDRENVLPGTYKLYFNNEETQFSCSADFDLSQGLMMLTAPGKQQVYRSLDTCQQAEALQVPWLETCVSKTPADLKMEKMKTGGMGSLLAAMGAYVLLHGAGAGIAKLMFPLAERWGWQGGMARFSRWRLPLFHSLRGGLNRSVFNFVDAEGETVGLLRRFFAPKATIVLQEQPYLSRIDRLNRAAQTPGAPWHRGAKFLRSLGHASGPAYLLGLLYDGVAAMFVDRHHQARQVGTTAVTLTGLGALTLAEHRLLQAQIARGLAPKSLLAHMPKGAAVSRLANRLLWVGIFDLGMRYLAVGSDYDAWVNERVTEEIYKQDKVYEYLPDWEDFSFVDDVAMGWTKPIRGSARWLAPSAMEWAVACDNEEIEVRIRREDIEDSLAIKSGMKEMLLTLALNPHYDQETGSESISQTFDFSIFTRRAAAPNLREGFIAGLVESLGYEKAKSMIEASDEELESALIRAWRHNFQNQAAFLVAVEGAQNDWAREIFTKDGTLKSGREEELVRALFGSREHWGQYATEMARSLKLPG